MTVLIVIKIKHIPLENVRDKKSDQGVQDDIQ